MYMATYGHRHLGFFFRPVVELNEQGLRFGGLEYSWSAITRVEVRESPFDPLVGYFVGGHPWATVYLNDGKSIRLNGRALEKRGEKAKVGFFSSKSNAFRELITSFGSHGVTITPSAGAIVLQFGKLIASALIGLLLIFAILRYLDTTL
jgi:hypothetical protein